MSPAMSYEERLTDAKASCATGMRRVETQPEPEGQKFPRGSRVRIADDLGSGMSHFPGKGGKATVQHVYAHAFGGDDVKPYCLDIDGYGEVSWYYESQLTAIPGVALEADERERLIAEQQAKNKAGWGELFRVVFDPQTDAEREFSKEFLGKPEDE